MREIQKDRERPRLREPRLRTLAFFFLLTHLLTACSVRLLGQNSNESESALGAQGTDLNSGLLGILTIDTVAAESVIDAQLESAFSIGGSCRGSFVEVSAGGSLLATEVCDSSGRWSASLDLRGILDGDLTLVASDPGASGESSQASRSFLKDTLPPTRPGGLSFASIANDGLTLQWNKASDVHTPQSQIKYRLYYSIANNLGDVEQIEANGTPVGDWQTDISSFTYTGLIASKKYTFNLIAMDNAGNKVAYPMRAKMTYPICAGDWTGNLSDNGSGSLEDPYVICTLAQLDAVRTSPSLHYELGADIDASVTATWNDAGGGVYQGFVPIPYFTGSIDGKSHQISNLMINRPSNSDIGFFSIISGKWGVRNLRLVNVNITGGGYTGGLAGNLYGSNLSRNATIENCSVSGSVTGGSYTGGLLGYVTGGQVLGSSSSASITANGAVSRVGGLVGLVRDNGKVAYSYATGNVTGTQIQRVGGLVGHLWSGSVLQSYALGTVNGGADYGGGGLVGYNYDGTIRNSYAKGNVNKSGSANGGLAGYNNGGLIENSYATGNATTSGTWGAGGLVGNNWVESFFSAGQAATILNSFSTGQSSASSDIGGLVGYNGMAAAGTSAIISNSYWDSVSSGRGSMCGAQAGGSGTATGCDNAKAINTGPGYWYNPASAPLNSWDFSANGGYWLASGTDFPALRFQSEPLKNRIFITSVAFDGNLMAGVAGYGHPAAFVSGYEGADFRCTYLANLAGFGGKWKALLGGSSVGGPLYDILPLGQVVDSTSTVVAADMRALDQLNFSAAVTRDETGTLVSSAQVWTGSTPSALADTNHCSNWTSNTAGANGMTGTTGLTTSGWLSGATADCSTQKRLYCISQ